MNKQQREYMAYYPLVRRIVVGSVRKQAALHGWQLSAAEMDERVANGLAWSWALYCRYRRGRDAKTAAISAAKYGARRRRPLGCTRPARYHDAMDGRPRDDGLDLVPAREAGAGAIGDAEGLIGRLSASLQPTARLLSYGLSQSDVSRRLGVSTSTIGDRVNAIREQVSAYRAIDELTSR